MNGLPSWSFAGMRRRRAESGGRVEKIRGGGGCVEHTVEDVARERQVHRERPVWVSMSLQLSTNVIRLSSNRESH